MLIIATKNSGKLREIKQILKSIDIPIVSLANLKKKPRIVENADTFSANACKKALPVSRLYPKDIVLGEDSGLTVNYLNGLPGVKSKRYAGPSGDPTRNNSKLLKTLKITIQDQDDIKRVGRLIQQVPPIGQMVDDDQPHVHFFDYRSEEVKDDRRTDEQYPNVAVLLNSS